MDVVHGVVALAPSAGIPELLSKVGKEAKPERGLLDTVAYAVYLQPKMSALMAV